MRGTPLPGGSDPGGVTPAAFAGAVELKEEGFTVRCRITVLCRITVVCRRSGEVGKWGFEAVGSERFDRTGVNP